MKFLSLSFDNFFSFGAEQELVFSDPLKRLVGDSRFETLPNNTNVSLSSVILGANGSGKTNALKTLSFLSWFVCSSFRSLDEGEKIPFHRFYFVKSNKLPTNFRVTFEHKEEIYSYCLVLCASHTRILYEEVSKLNSKTNRYTYMLKREYDEKEKIYNIVKKDINISIRALREFLRSNCSMVSASRKMSETGLEKILEAFGSVYGNVNLSGRDSSEEFDIGEATDFYYSNEDYKKRVEEIIVDLDLGISKIKLKKEQFKSLPKKVIKALKSTFGEFDADESGSFTTANAVHRVGENNYELPLIMESGGTKVLYCTLRHVIPALHRGGVAVIDELELGLHPFMVEKLLKLFIEPGSNPNRAQLIATTHSANVLEHLDSRQILFVEKDEDNLQSEVWRLSDIRGVLPRDNFFRSYMSGKYGAIPRV